MLQHCASESKSFVAMLASVFTWSWFTSAGFAAFQMPFQVSQTSVSFKFFAAKLARSMGERVFLSIEQSLERRNEIE